MVDHETETNNPHHPLPQPDSVDSAFTWYGSPVSITEWCMREVACADAKRLVADREAAARAAAAGKTHVGRPSEEGRRG